MASRTPAASASSGPASAPHDHDVPRFPVDNHGLLILGMMLTSTMQVLDMTVANVALPHMQSALGTTNETITWVLTSYIVAGAVALPLAGWLTAKIGVRNLFIYAIIGFVVTSMLCGMAQTIEEMVIFRALQGMTGTFFLPLSQSTMLDTTRPSKHAQMMALWGSVTMVGPILGPVLGGWLTEYWSWRWVFYVNLPIGMLALVLVLAQLPDIREQSRRFDMLGFVLVASGLAALQLLLDRGNQIGWFDDAEAWIYLFIVLSAAWVAIIHTVTAQHPLFDRRLFLDVNLVATLIFMVVLGAILYATLSLLPPLIQDIYGYDTIDTGLLLAPRGIGFVVAARMMSPLQRWNIDFRMTVAAGLIAMGVGCAMMTQWTITMSQWDIILPGFMQGIGMAFIFISMNTFAFVTVAPEFRTDAAILLGVFRTVGSSIGISVMATLFGRNMQVGHSELGERLQSRIGGMVDATTLDRFPMVGDTVLRLVDAEVNRQAAMIAYINDFQVMVWMCIATAPLLLLLRPSRHRA